MSIREQLLDRGSTNQDWSKVPEVQPAVESVFVGEARYAVGVLLGSGYRRSRRTICGSGQNPTDGSRLKGRCESAAGPPNERAGQVRTRIHAALLLALVGACAPSADRGEGIPREPYLFAWTTDSDSSDLNFLAVVDVSPGSDSYGDVLSTLAVPTTGRTRGHHTEHRVSAGGFLFANDFGTGKTYILDLRDPLSPSVADSFVAAGPLMSSHSFERLPGGNVIATFQNEGPGNADAGGLAELDARGRTVRWARAAAGDRYIRPYSLAVVPELDRVVTGSADMRGAADSRVLQVWQLSDLALLATLELPEEWGAAAEPRVLPDGETVLVSTFGCKLLLVEDLETDTPSVSLAYDFGGENCAVPVVAHNLWIQTVPGIHGLVALDVSNPERPREVSRLVLGDDDWPHWISLEPGGRRIVVPGVSFDRMEWPHGPTGPGDPHGVVFSRSASFAR